MQGRRTRGLIGVERTKPGSVSALLISYYRSPQFLGLSDTTKGNYRAILERFREAHGDKPVKHLERRHVARILAEKAETPAAANNLRKRLIGLLDHAIELDWRPDNPARATKPYRIESGGYHTWSEREIARFFEVHRPGTPAHTSVTLMLYTGAARVDAVAIGWQNVKAGRIEYRRQKTKRSGGELISIPIHPDLAAVLDTCPKGALAFLQTAQGKPRSVDGLGNAMRKWTDKAALPDCSAHGLREACARRLAEAGATPHEIMAITGHKTLSEVERYTRAFGREGLADSAMAKLAEGPKSERNVVNLPDRFAKKAEK